MHLDVGRGVYPLNILNSGKYPFFEIFPFCVIKIGLGRDEISCAYPDDDLVIELHLFGKGLDHIAGLPLIVFFLHKGKGIIINIVAAHVKKSELRTHKALALAAGTYLSHSFERRQVQPLLVVLVGLAPHQKTRALDICRRAEEEQGFRGIIFALLYICSKGPLPLVPLFIDQRHEHIRLSVPGLIEQILGFLHNLICSHFRAKTRR